MNRPAEQEYESGPICPGRKQSTLEQAVKESLTTEPRVGTIRLIVPLKSPG